MERKSKMMIFFSPSNCVSKVCCFEFLANVSLSVVDSFHYKWQDALFRFTSLYDDHDDDDDDDDWVCEGMVRGEDVYKKKGNKFLA